MRRGFRKGRHKVFCEGCAYLLYLGGTAPLCVATAEFVEGPLRPRIEVVGVVSAEKRNVHNDCEFRVSVSRKAWKIKKWLIGRLNYGNTEGKRIEEVGISEYNYSKEYQRKKNLLRETYDRIEEEDSSGDEEQYIDLSIDDSEREDAFDNGGADSNEDSESPGEIV